MIITLYYLFFTIGINSISKYFFRDNEYQNKLKNRYPIPIRPIAIFIFLLVYCSFSNIVLLFPLLIRYLSFSNQIINNANSLSQYIISISSFLLVIYGMIDCIKILKKNNLKKIFNN